MDDQDLKALINAKIESGIGGESNDLSTKRQEIIDRYYGELYGNEKEGQSKVTTREVFETVEWAMPSLIRPFESGERIVEFDSNDPWDDSRAEQESDAVNYVYQKDNNGFTVTHNIIKSALLAPNSYVKVYRDEREEICKESYSNMAPQEIALLMQNEGVEVIGQEQNEDGTYNLEIKIVKKYGKNRVECIPEEDIIIDNEHSELDLDECEFVCHRVERTRSYLIQLGYSAIELDEVNPDDTYDIEDSNRKTYSAERGWDDDDHEALRKYIVEECYLMFDWDDDGIAERRRVVKIGDKIFENEEMDYMPIASAVSILMPHKHTGYALAQSILDLQEIKTFFTRQLVTNMARVNNPRTLITPGANLSDILNPRANGIIRIKNPGDVTTEPTNPIIGQVMPLLDLFDQMKEGRTGVTRNSMGLDADVLAKSTEGAFMGALEKADQRVEFIVRLLAETVFKKIFLKIHHLLLTHGDVKWMKLSGQWVPVNPREWKKRESMTVKVGLGMGNRREKMAGAQMIIAEQDKLVAQGAMGVLVNQQNIYNARRLLVESVGQKAVDKFFMNPSMSPPPQPQPPQPDPNMLMIQAQQQIEQGKRQVEMAKLQQQARSDQTKMQLDYARFQFDQAKMQREAQFDQIELEYKRQIDNLKAQIDQEKVDNQAGAEALRTKVKELEMQLDKAQADEKLQMEKYKADLDAQTKILLKQMDGQSTEEQHDLNLINTVLEQMNKPKRIITDEEGNPIGVETV